MAIISNKITYIKIKKKNSYPTAKKQWFYSKSILVFYTHQRPIFGFKTWCHSYPGCGQKPVYKTTWKSQTANWSAFSTKTEHSIENIQNVPWLRKNTQIEVKNRLFLSLTRVFFDWYQNPNWGSVPSNRDVFLLLKFNKL